MTQTDLDKLVILLRRGQGITNEITALINKLYKELYNAVELGATTDIQKYNAIRESLTAQKQIFSEIDLSDEIEGKLVQVSAKTIAIYDQLKPIKPTKALVNRALSIIMPDSNISTNDMITRTENLTKSSVTNYTIQAVNDGWTKKQLRDALNTSATRTNQYVQTIVNTSVNAVMNETKKELFAANDDIIDRVLFSATLDGKTSDICMSLDGKAFLLEDAPILPLHPNERSQLLPILKGETEEEVMEQVLPRPNVKPDDYNKKTGNYDLEGGVSYSENYEEWLKKQPAYYQEDIIGVKASKEFREGASLNSVIKLSPITESYLDKAL